MNENLTNNLISFRRQRNISTKELASVLSMTEDEYMKFEYGIEYPTLEVLKKLASFYGVEPASFFVMQQSYNGRQVKTNQYGQANVQLLNREKYTCSKVACIFLLILSAAFFIFAIFDFYGINMRMESFGETHNYRETASLYDLFDADGLYVFMLVLLILVAIWDIVDNILLLSGSWSKGKYSKVSSIFKLISTGISIVAFSVIIIRLLTESSISQSIGSAEVSSSIFLCYGGCLILIAWLLITSITKIIAFAKTKRVA